MEKYAGEYESAILGGATLSVEGAALSSEGVSKRSGFHIQLEAHETLSGELMHWHYDTFVARWRDRTLSADAYVTFALKPDGIFLSNGPGDPEPCTYAIDAIRRLVDGGTPTFGICLGHQLLGLASGGRTLKMKFGHHGANHPVLDRDSGQVLITSQNHGFAVDPASLPATVRVTHVSLFDGSLQGIARTDRPAFGFQGHPEASPGPHDIRPLFDRFIKLMEKN